MSSDGLIKIVESMSHTKHDVWMNTNRIETLVDGVFAIALTLIVLSIDVPQISGNVTDAFLLQYLNTLSGQLLIYAFSFLLLASFWRANHRQFFFIRKSDSTLIWITLVWLMFIALVPFSTDFVSSYGSHMIPMLFFNFNMFFIGIFFILTWTYVNRKGFFIESMTKDRYERAKRINYTLPIVAIVAILITFVQPLWSPYVYILIFIMKVAS